MFLRTRSSSEALCTCSKEDALLVCFSDGATNAESCRSWLKCNARTPPAFGKSGRALPPTFSVDSWVVAPLGDLHITCRRQFFGILIYLS